MRVPRAALALAGTLTALTACEPAPEGVWLLEIAEVPEDDLTCSYSPSHNFEDAWVPTEETEDSPWSSSSVESWSPRTLFALITASPEGAVLVLDGKTFPGIETERGWLFEWSDDTLVQESSLHESGYAFSYDKEAAQTFSLSGTFEGGLFQGSWEAYDETWEQWTESDTWAQEVADTIGTGGQIPVGSYLVTETYDEATAANVEVAASNSWDGYDCADTCTLTVSTWCGSVFEATGERTSLDPEAFESVDGAGQSAGY